MPHRLYDRRVRVTSAEREYQAVRIALDLLGNAAGEEIYAIADQRGWNDLAAAEIYATERNLDGTYLIRMYSVFERAVVSFWRRLPGNEASQVDGDVMVDEVGYVQLMDEGVIASAQAVRSHRNSLVHRRIEDHALAMPIESASRDLLTYLNRLPATWD